MCIWNTWLIERPRYLSNGCVLISPWSWGDKWGMCLGELGGGVVVWGQLKATDASNADWIVWGGGGWGLGGKRKHSFCPLPCAWESSIENEDEKDANIQCGRLNITIHISSYRERGECSGGCQWGGGGGNMGTFPCLWLGKDLLFFFPFSLPAQWLLMYMDGGYDTLTL